MQISFFFSGRILAVLPYQTVRICAMIGLKNRFGNANHKEMFPEWSQLPL